MSRQEMVDYIVAVYEIEQDRDVTNEVSKLSDNALKAKFSTVVLTTDLKPHDATIQLINEYRKFC